MADEVPALVPVDRRGREGDEGIQVEGGLEDLPQLLRVARGQDEHPLPPRERPRRRDAIEPGLGGREDVGGGSREVGMGHEEEMLARPGRDGVELPELAGREERHVVEVGVRSQPPSLAAVDEREEEILHRLVGVVSAHSIALDHVQGDRAGRGPVPGHLTIGGQLGEVVQADLELVVGETQTPEAFEEQPLTSHECGVRCINGPHEGLAVTGQQGFSPTLEQLNDPPVSSTRVDAVFAAPGADGRRRRQKQREGEAGRDPSHAASLQKPAAAAQPARGGGPPRDTGGRSSASQAASGVTSLVQALQRVACTGMSVRQCGHGRTSGAPVLVAR